MRGLLLWQEMRRRSTRAPVICQNCKAHVYWLSSIPVGGEPNVVLAQTTEPPNAQDQCPECGAAVDTTVAYPVLPNFPPAFDALHALWQGFVPTFEYHRASPEDALEDITPQDLAESLNDADAFSWLKQRLFYRSTMCFSRAFELFFATLTLEHRSYKTWAEVTAYYSRFFSIQSLLNLVLTSFIRHRSQETLVYYTGADVRTIRPNHLPPPMRNKGPHERWWLLMEALKVPTDYPSEHLGFVLSRAYYNPDQRNTVNYSFDYISGGFPELDWFDQDARNMMAHFHPHRRADEDITDIDRFFEGHDPDSIDTADFYGDPMQVVWLSLRVYLELLQALDIRQSFITTEKIAALAEVHLVRDYPRIARGVLLETTDLLGDVFDVDVKLREIAARERGYTFFQN
jgi:hypothetical protein